MEPYKKRYRLEQLNRVDTEYSEYKTKIKIIKPNGETNWIDLDPEEFNQIKNILIGEGVHYERIL